MKVNEMKAKTKKVGITVKLFESDRDAFKEACYANYTDMDAYLARQALSYVAKHKSEITEKELLSAYHNNSA